MSAIVNQFRQGLTVRTEVGVVANSTLVSVSHNVFTLVSAKRTITEDTDVMLVASGLLGHWLIKWD